MGLDRLSAKKHLEGSASCAVIIIIWQTLNLWTKFVKKLLVIRSIHAASFVLPA